MTDKDVNSCASDITFRTQKNMLNRRLHIDSFLQLQGRPPDLSSAGSGITGGVVHLRLQHEVSTRFTMVGRCLNRAEICLSLFENAHAQLNGQTFREISPYLDVFAQGFVDQLHIAVMLTKSLPGIEVADLDLSTRQKRGGPYKIEDVDPDVARELNEATKRLDRFAKDLKGIRDTAHHVDERVNWKAGKRSIEQTGGMLIGVFQSGPPPTITSTAVGKKTDQDPSKKTNSVPGYEARLEISRNTLDAYEREILAVFTSLPWEGPPPAFR